MTPAPTSFESAMSLLTLAVAAIDKHPPTSWPDIARLDIMTTTLDTIGTRAMRKMETMR